MQWRCIWRVDTKHWTNTMHNTMITWHKIHPKSKMKDVVEACNSWTCLVERSPPQVVNNQVFTNQYIDSSTGSLLWRDFQLDNVWDVSNQTKRRGEWEITAARRQAGGCVLMTTNKRPLIMMWSKTAPKGTKRANGRINNWWGSHTSWQTRKRKWWLIWQWNCGMHGFDELKCIWTWIDMARSGMTEMLTGHDTRTLNIAVDN